MTKTLLNLKAGDVLYTTQRTSSGAKVLPLRVHSFGELRVRLLAENGKTVNFSRRDWDHLARIKKDSPEYFFTKEEAEKECVRLDSCRTISDANRWFLYHYRSCKLSTETLKEMADTLKTMMLLAENEQQRWDNEQERKKQEELREKRDEG